MWTLWCTLAISHEKSDHFHIQMNLQNLITMTTLFNVYSMVCCCIKSCHTQSAIYWPDNLHIKTTPTNWNWLLISLCQYKHKLFFISSVISNWFSTYFLNEFCWRGFHHVSLFKYWSLERNYSVTSHQWQNINTF